VRKNDTNTISSMNKILGEDHRMELVEGNYEKLDDLVKAAKDCKVVIFVGYSYFHGF
jgi:hypothetical protein